MNAVSEIEPTAGTTGATPGAMLRDERERRGLTVQQVSEELHLDTWLVDALEENRFPALGAPVYAKGHLRKYAVLLGLPPELILARYQAIATPPPPPPPPVESLIAPPSERRIDLRRLDWRMYAIIGGLVLSASGVGWLVAQPGRSASAGAQPTPSAKPTPVVAASEAEASNTPPEAAPAAAANPTLAKAPAANAPESSAARVPPAAADNHPQPAPKVQTAVAAVPRPATQQPATPAATAPKPAAPTLARVTPQPSAAAPKPAPAAVTPTAVQPTPAPAVQAAKVVTPAPAATATPEGTDPAVDSVPQVSLRLEFTTASWAEVYDGDGKRLMYSIGDPNKPRTVSGKAPLKVTLGTAGSVQARVNGRPIAIPRRIGQESASFSVNANGSIRLR